MRLSYWHWYVGGCGAKSQGHQRLQGQQRRQDDRSAAVAAVSVVPVIRTMQLSKSGFRDLDGQFGLHLHIGNLALKGVHHGGDSGVGHDFAGFHRVHRRVEG